MKRFFQILRKILFVLLYLFFVIACVALSVLLYNKTTELNRVNDAYNETALLLNKSEEESGVTIENLQKNFKDLNDEVKRLEQTNQSLQTELDRQLRNGYGTIQGKILPLIVGGSSFSQYQLICAESVSNSNIKFCATASAYDSDFTLVLPSGEYIVTANIVSRSSDLDAKYRGEYTEFVSCVNQKKEAECSRNALSGKVLNVKVESGQTIRDINPTDWKEL